MSFILHDKNLLNELLKLAQQGQAAPATPAAPAAPVAADPEKLKGVALKFVNNLVGHVSNSGDEFTSEKQNTTLNPANLEDFPKFLNFLQSNGISIGGKKIIIRHFTRDAGFGQGTDQDYTLLSDADKKLYAKYPDVDGDNFQYYVYKDGILKYLQQLQTEAAENTPRGRTLRMYVKKLIADVSNELELEMPAAKDPNAIDAKQSLDAIPDVMDVENPYDSGTHNILQSDLASNASLWQWLSKEQLKLKDGDDIKDTKAFTGKKEMCQVVNYLYARASRDVSTRNDAVAKLYLRLVTDLARAMGCPLGGEQPSGAQPSGLQNVGYVTTSGSFTPAGQTAMANIELPLIRGQIVFERIKRFATSYLKIYPKSDIARNVLTALNEIDQYKVPALQLRQDTYQMIDSQIRANTNNTKSGGDYIQRVETMLLNAKTMLMQIQEMFRRSGTGNASDAATDPVEGYKAELDDQVRNIYMENSGGLDILKNQYQDIVRRVIQQGRN